MLIWRNEAIRTIFVTPGQDLVSDEAQALRKEFQSWSGHRAERLVLDLARVQAIDPEGLETILALYNWLRAIGGELVIENASAELKSFFQLMRGDGRLTISGTGWPGSKDRA